MAGTGLLGAAWREVRRRRGRAAACVLGHALAAFAVVAVTLLAGPRLGARADLLHTVGTHLIGFVPDPLYECGRGVGPVAQGVYTAMLRGEDLRRIREIGGVRAAAPYLLFQRQDLNTHATVSIGGLDLGDPSTPINACSPEDVIAGRYLEAADGEVVLAEESFARSRGLKAGDVLEEFGRRFRVVGLVNTNIRAVKANLYAPLPVVRQVVAEARCVKQEAGDFNVVLVEVEDARRMEEVQEALEKVLAAATVVRFNCYQPAREAAAEGRAAAGGFAGALVLFAALWAGRSQAASVSERRGEIGVLKVLGWPGGRVARQILAESGLQALAGGILGSAGGLAAALLGRGSVVFGEAVRSPDPALAGGAVLAGLILVLGAGLAGGLWPALRAYRLSPSEALRRL